MSRTTALLVAPAMLLLAACGAAAQPSPSAIPTATATPAPTVASSATAAPTSLDPCQLVTAQEASSLTGATYSAGKPETTEGGAKMCVYGAQTLDVLMVLVTQASDPATAQADWSQEEAKAKSALQGNAQGANINVNVTDTTISGADKAAVVQGSGSFSGHTVQVSAVYLLKGSTFVAMSDLAVDRAAASGEALQTQAQTTLGRI